MEIVASIRRVARCGNVRTNASALVRHVPHLGKGEPLSALPPLHPPPAKAQSAASAAGKAIKGGNMKQPDARPSKTARLPETRVTPEELGIIKAKAQKAGLTVSEYQRRAVINGKVIVRQTKADAALIRNLAAIGNNLNQLVRKTHIHDETDTQKMRDILAVIEEIIGGLCDRENQP